MGEALFKVKQTALKTGSEEFRQYQNILRAVTLSVGEARDVMSGMQGGNCRGLRKFVKNKNPDG